MEGYIAAIDIGTSKVCCHIIDSRGQTVGKSMVKVKNIHPERGWMEIDPEALWQDFVLSVRNGIEDAKCTIDDIATMGISTQRNTITIWNKDTGQALYNFITWQDTRVSGDVYSWNSSIRLKVANFGGKIGFFVTRHKFFKAASVLSFSTMQVTLRLLWLLNNVTEAKQMIREGNLLYGTLDSWIIWKLTLGKLHVTDYSSASSSGLFNPYMPGWSHFVSLLTGVPLSIFPKIVDCSGCIGTSGKEVFGRPIPITASIADQQASLFGQACFNVGDLTCTMGTGTFMCMNCGSTPYASLAGLYPLVGWKLKDSNIVYAAEGNASSTGSVIEWLCDFGLFNSPQDIIDAAASVDDTNGLYFVPAFHGLQAPYKDSNASPLFVGLNFETTKAHVARAVLESFAYRVRQIYETFLEESGMQANTILLSGGVATSDFVAQLISDVLQKDVHRTGAMNASLKGAAYLAGLGIGIWKNLDDIQKLTCKAKTYSPNINVSTKLNKSFKTWKKSVKRSLGWHEKPVT